MTDRSHQILAVIVIIVCLVGAIIVLAYQYSLERQKVEDLKMSLMLTQMALVIQSENNLLHQIEAMEATQRILLIPDIVHDYIESTHTDTAYRPEYEYRF